MSPGCSPCWCSSPWSCTYAAAAAGGAQAGVTSRCNDSVMSRRPTPAELLLQARQRLHVLEAMSLTQERWVDVLTVVADSENVDEARRRIASLFNVDAEQAAVMVGVQFQRVSQDDRRRI